MTATDVTIIQPEWVPPNLRFEIEDCTKPWTFEPASFDYIHMRFLIGIPDWAALMREAFKALKPGGWVESFEGSVHIKSDDGTVTKEMALGQWGDIFIKGSHKFGRSFALHEDGTVRA